MSEKFSKSLATLIEILVLIVKEYKWGHSFSITDPFHMSYHRYTNEPFWTWAMAMPLNLSRSFKIDLHPNEPLGLWSRSFPSL
jgi:hypothetical protein